MEINTAFMTHHGLKVRLNHDFCVEYLNEESILPWYISIEAFDSLRQVLSIITAIIMMFLHIDFVHASGNIAIMYLVGYFISQSYFEMVLLNWIYGLFYMVYSALERLFIQYIALVVVAIITKEYWLLLSYLVARIICFIIANVVNIIILKYNHNKYGVAIGDVEITAAKLLQFYTNRNIKFKQWIKEYSTFLNSKEAV